MKLRLVGVIPIYMFIGSLFAQNSVEIDEILITSHRQNNFIQTSVVVDKEEIAVKQAQSSVDLLRNIPGLNIAQQGGVLHIPRISLRGTNSDQSLILLDGIRLNSATGASALQYINPSQIESIEVIRGSRSSIFGADALGGVVNLYTKKHSQQKNTTNLQVTGGVGTYNTQDASVGIIGNRDRLDYNFGAFHYQSKGFDIAEHTYGPKDKDTKDSTGFNAGIDFSLNNNIKFGALALLNQGEIEYDNPRGWFNLQDSSTNLSDPYSKFRTSSIGVFATSNFHRWQSRLEINRQENKTEDIDRLNINNSFNLSTSRENFALHNNFVINNNYNMIFGIDSATDRLKSSEMYQKNSRYNYGIFNTHVIRLSNVGFEVGARYEDNEQFGNKTVFNTAISHNLYAQKFQASFNEGFRVPSFNDLYFPNSGNSGLKPETSKTYTISYQNRQIQNTNIDANIWYSKLTDVIAWVADYSNNWAPQNVNQVAIKGADFSARYAVGNFLLGTSHTVVYAKDVYNDRYLVNRPKYTAAINIDYISNLLSLGLDIYGQANNFEDTNNQINTAGYTLVDLRAQYRVNNQLKFTAKITNALDKTYAIKQYTALDGNYYPYLEAQREFRLGVVYDYQLR